MNEVEGIGTAVTGGLVARAIEPEAGEAAHGEGRCLNCGTGLIGPHCHTCGQAGHVHRTLGAFWHDLLHSVLHFEGKIWRTLPMLAWRPGELTRRYIRGERASFVSPLAMFLFSVFLMFAIFNAIGAQAYADRTPSKAAGSTQGTASEGMDMDLADAPPVLRWLDAPYKKAKANPSLLMYKLQANAYKFSWALIPLSVPLVWLLFLHRRRYREYGVYDHTVFVTYSIAFMSLIAVGYTLLKLMGMIGTAALLPFVIPPIHMYRQLRGAYDLSKWSALWRTVALVGFALLAGFLFFTMLLAMGVLA